MQIPVDKIRDVIGPGGKMIRSIIEQTGVKILAVVLQRRRRGPLADRRYLTGTETGGILITPLPGATPLKPGSRRSRSSA